MNIVIKPLLFVAFLTIVLNGQAQMAEILKLDKSAFMIDSRQKMKINLKGEFNGKVMWTSSNNNVATVSQDGVVKGFSHGDAVITALYGTQKAECIASVDYEGQNPILPPTWGLFIADGEPHVFNGKMYIFGSRDVENGFLPTGERDWCSRDYHVIFSEDLIHWIDGGIILSLSDIPDEFLNEGDNRLWAPDIFKSPLEKDKYYLTFCVNNNNGMFIAESKSPLGSFINVKQITLNNEPVRVIDPGTLVDNDGKVYMANPDFYISQLDPADYSKIIPGTYHTVKEYMPYDNQPFEGPSLRKRANAYYYIYIQNKGNIEKDGAVPTRMAYMTSKQPLGPYSYKGLIITNYEYMNAGNIHGSIEEFKGQWYVSYHMPLAENKLTRVACLDKLDFNSDGTIKQVLPTSSGAKGYFEAGDKIQASSGILFSGGRGDVRIKTRKEPTENKYVFNYFDYPYSFYSEAGQWICYRYMKFERKIDNLQIRVSTESHGAEIEIRRGTENGELISTLTLPDMNGKWETIEAPVKIENNGVEEFYIVLKSNNSKHDVKIDWLIFGNN
jgi:hypothetical protein